MKGELVTQLHRVAWVEGEWNKVKAVYTPGYTWSHVWNIVNEIR